MYIQPQHVFSYRLTFVKPLQSGDVIFAHLGGRAKLNICVRDGHHSGFIVPGEGIPGIIKGTDRSWYLNLV